MKRIELVHRRGYLQAEMKLVFAVFDIPGVPHVQTVTLAFADAVFS
jgi:hypothetical protein